MASVILRTIPWKLKNTVNLGCLRPAPGQPSFRVKLQLVPDIVYLDVTYRLHGISGSGYHITPALALALALARQLDNSSSLERNTLYVLMTT